MKLASQFYADRIQSYKETGFSQQFQVNGKYVSDEKNDGLQNQNMIDCYLPTLRYIFKMLC